MEAEFWHQRWERGEIGFHQDEVNPMLAEHFQQLAQGYQVVGSEQGKSFPVGTPVPQKIILVVKHLVMG